MINRFAKILSIIIGIFILIPSAFATHQRAGEITYRYISGLTYEFTIVTYTYTPSPADRPEIEIYWGDGTSSEIQRLSKINLANNVSRNTYITEHTFSAVGTYHISFEDPNRNAGIVNIPSSVEIPFYIETTLIINPFVGGNSSPTLLNPPLDNGCVNTPYYHNPGAYDVDGDSLSYKLINCRGLDGEAIPGYSLPYASNFIEIDEITGELSWDSPTMAGEYNIAILIEEWRNGMLIGSVVRDMQITIAPCNNQPPVIEANDTCVVAGSYIDMLVKVSDNTSTFVSLTATGGPFLVETSPAAKVEVYDSVDYYAHFTWKTECEHVKLKPYEVVFKARDNGPNIELVSYKTIHIKVIAPAPENLVATPSGNSIKLDWSPDVCSNAIGYDIYKRTNEDEYEPDSCETGLPTYIGYTKIGETNSWQDTTFIDHGDVMPINHGNTYCYRVVARFPDGAESIVSEKVCANIRSDAPLIINTDVTSTDSASGSVLVRWLFPPEMDSVAFNPPYYYNLYRDNQLIYFTEAQSNPYDTLSFIDDNLNTRDYKYSYHVTISNSDTLIEKSDLSETIFLNITPSDRKLILTWEDFQPWDNIEYSVYRLNKHTDNWDSVATVQETEYIDYNLTNGEEYCYFVRAKGYYWKPDTIGALYNNSQQNCSAPFDNEPPEMPEIAIYSDCQNIEFQWLFSSDTSAVDAAHYYIFYKTNLNEKFTCIDSFDNNQICYPNPCSYSINATESQVLVGCYAMQLADSNYNYTALSDSVCLDVFDCLEYQLPNVFTPNGDGINDLFTPHHPYFGVTKIDIEIYDRWGKRVFRTNNPDIMWDGTDEWTKLPVPDGVYFYGCKLYINTLAGEINYFLNGSITLIR